MQIRLARQEDIPEICHIYELAREHMRAEGNTSQWKKYPNETNAFWKKMTFWETSAFLQEKRKTIGRLKVELGERRSLTVPYIG